ncbi:protein of unknown function [Thauera humireducens]|nr:protein of unknown function [Thauera humireducens]
MYCSAAPGGSNRTPGTIIACGTPLESMLSHHDLLHVASAKKKGANERTPNPNRET